MKEAGRDFTYFIVVLVGIGVTGYFLNYYSLSEDSFYYFQINSHSICFCFYCRWFVLCDF